MNLERKAEGLDEYLQDSGRETSTRSNTTRLWKIYRSECLEYRQMLPMHGMNTLNRRADMRHHET
jgi:hypothetical protein